jgi:hypothetical protein
MEGLYIVEEKARTFCPKCKNELVYEQLYNLDLIMYCESCSYKGIVIDCYKDEMI